MTPDYRKSDMPVFEGQEEFCHSRGAFVIIKRAERHETPLRIIYKRM